MLKKCLICGFESKSIGPHLRSKHAKSRKWKDKQYWQLALQYCPVCGKKKGACQHVNWMILEAVMHPKFQTLTDIVILKRLLNLL